MHEGLDEHDLALVAGRVLAKLAAGVEVEPFDQLLQIRAVDAAPQVGEVLEDLPARQVAIEGGLAGHVTDEALDLQSPPPAVEACDAGRPAIGTDQRHERADGGGLAGPVGPEKTEHLTFRHGERHVFDPTLAAIALGQLVDLDDVWHRRLLTRTTHA